jgi:hypothetical protein
LARAAELQAEREACAAAAAEAAGLRDAAAARAAQIEAQLKGDLPARRQQLQQQREVGECTLGAMTTAAGEVFLPGLWMVGAGETVQALLHDV